MLAQLFKCRVFLRQQLKLLGAVIYASLHLLSILLNLHLNVTATQCVANVSSDALRLLCKYFRDMLVVYLYDE